MKQLYVVGSLLAFAACALQTGSGMAQTAPIAAAFDGNYQGSLSLSASGLSTDNAHRSKCVEERPATMTIRNGAVFIEYANWRGHKLHYRGKVDAVGAVNAYHRNSDGTTAQLNGRISNNVLTGNMRRDICAYTVMLTRM
jgi:Tfp pilus tip-associated adhesin PilY1